MPLTSPRLRTHARRGPRRRAGRPAPAVTAGLHPGTTRSAPPRAGTRGRGLPRSAPPATTSRPPGSGPTRNARRRVHALVRLHPPSDADRRRAAQRHQQVESGNPDRRRRAARYEARQQPWSSTAPAAPSRLRVGPLIVRPRRRRAASRRPARRRRRHRARSPRSSTPATRLLPRRATNEPAPPSASPTRGPRWTTPLGRPRRRAQRARRRRPARGRSPRQGPRRRSARRRPPLARPLDATRADLRAAAPARAAGALVARAIAPASRCTAASSSVRATASRAAAGRLLVWRGVRSGRQPRRGRRRRRFRSPDRHQSLDATTRGPPTPRRRVARARLSRRARQVPRAKPRDRLLAETGGLPRRPRAPCAGPARETCTPPCGPISGRIEPPPAARRPSPLLGGGRRGAGPASGQVARQKPGADGAVGEDGGASIGRLAARRVALCGLDDLRLAVGGEDGEARGGSRRVVESPCPPGREAPQETPADPQALTAREVVAAVGPRTPRSRRWSFTSAQLAMTRGHHDERARRPATPARRGAGERRVRDVDAVGVGGRSA